MVSEIEFWDTFAAFYDEYYDDERQPDDAEFYVELARDADGPVLEVGCGTGRVYLELLRAGVDASGIDLSAGMLDVLRERASEAGLDPRVRQADMRSFRAEREYGLVIVPFRAFLHNLTLADQKAALRSFRDALAPGGTLALNFFTPNFEFVCENYGEERVRTIEHEDEAYDLRVVTELDDAVEQIARTDQMLEQDGEVIRESSYRIALVSKREFELLLEATGWSDWTVYGGFDGDPLEDASQEMVWVVER